MARQDRDHKAEELVCLVLAVTMLIKVLQLFINKCSFNFNLCMSNPKHRATQTSDKSILSPSCARKHKVSHLDILTYSVV